MEFLSDPAMLQGFLSILDENTRSSNYRSCDHNQILLIGYSLASPNTLILLLLQECHSKVSPNSPSLNGDSPALSISLTTIHCRSVNKTALSLSMAKLSSSFLNSCKSYSICSLQTPENSLMSIWEAYQILGKLMQLAHSSGDICIESMPCFSCTAAAFSTPAEFCR